MAKRGEKPKIRRETKPDGGVVLTKEGGKDEEKKSGGKTQPTGRTYTPTPSKPASVFTNPYVPGQAKVYITPQCHYDLQYIVKACDIEISGLGLVDTTPDGLIIKEVFILDQTGSSANTTLDPEAQAKLMMELDAKGIDTGKLRFWWHSHPFSNADPTPSGQDMEQFAAFGRGAPGIAPDWYINAIFNQVGGAYWRLDIYRPIRTCVKIVPSMTHPDFISQDWEKEIKEKVKRGGGVTIHRGRGSRSGYAGWEGGYPGHWMGE